MFNDIESLVQRRITWCTSQNKYQNLISLTGWVGVLVWLTLMLTIGGFIVAHPTTPIYFVALLVTFGIWQTLKYGILANKVHIEQTVRDLTHNQIMSKTEHEVIVGLKRAVKDSEEEG